MNNNEGVFMENKKVIGKLRYHGDNFSFLHDTEEYEVINIKPPFVEIMNNGEITKFDMFLPHTNNRPIKYGKWEITEDLTGILNKELTDVRIGKLKYVGRTFDGLINEKIYNVIRTNLPYFIVKDESGFNTKYYIDHPGPNCNPLGYGSWIVVEDLYNIFHNHIFEKYNLPRIDDSLYKYYKFINGRIFRVSQDEETFQVINSDNEWEKDDMIAFIYDEIDYEEITDENLLEELKGLKEKEEMKK